MFSVDDTSGTLTNSGKTIKVDLSNYTKVGHGHQIIDIKDLESTLSNKASTNHTHKIDQIEKLRDTLSKKSDTGHTHDINTITNVSKLSHLEDVNIIQLSISKNDSQKDYTCCVDDQGNLNLFNGDIRIAQYLPSISDWVFSSYSMKEIDTTLENHYQVLQKIIQSLKDAGILTTTESQ